MNFNVKPVTERQVVVAYYKVKLYERKVLALAEDCLHGRITADEMWTELNRYMVAVDDVLTVIFD